MNSIRNQIAAIQKNNSKTNTSNNPFNNSLTEQDEEMGLQLLLTSGNTKSGFSINKNQTRLGLMDKVDTVLADENNSDNPIEFSPKENDNKLLTSKIKDFSIFQLLRCLDRNQLTTLLKETTKDKLVEMLFSVPKFKLLKGLVSLSKEKKLELIIQYKSPDYLIQKIPDAILRSILSSKMVDVQNLSSLSKGELINKVVGTCLSKNDLLKLVSTSVLNGIIKNFTKVECIECFQKVDKTLIISLLKNLSDRTISSSASYTLEASSVKNFFESQVS